MDNNTIDFKEWKVPTDWSQINLKKYEEIEAFYADKDKKVDIREIIHILCDKTIDEVNQLPSEFLDIILEKLSFIQEFPKEDKPSNKISIDGEEYIVNVMEKLKTGEFIAADTALKADKHDYASVLAILCRKKDEIYDSKFEAEEFENRKKMFEQQPILNILPIISFFLSCYIAFVQHSQLFTMVEEEINRIQKDLKTSKKIGVFKKSYMNWQMRKLKKSLKSTKSI